MFKDIIYKNVKDLYKIDEYGNVWSKYKHNYLKPKINKDGYLVLSLRTNNNEKLNVSVATLVAYHYLKPPQDILDLTVDHIDNNRQNNYYKNLQWLERADNTRKATSVSQVGSKNSMAKLNDIDVENICILLCENKLTYKEIGNIYNVSKSTINNIANRKNWRNISCKYNFPKITTIKNIDTGRYERCNI